MNPLKNHKKSIINKLLINWIRDFNHVDVQIVFCKFNTKNTYFCGFLLGWVFSKGKTLMQVQVEVLQRSMLHTKCSQSGTVNLKQF